MLTHATAIVTKLTGNLQVIYAESKAAQSCFYAVVDGLLCTADPRLRQIDALHWNVIMPKPPTYANESSYLQ